MPNSDKKLAKIAIIEDDEPIRSMYTTKFENAGFDVAGAGDGQEGLELVEKFKPDLILLDLLLPVTSGDKLLEKLRSEEWGRNILVIVLTNISADEAPMSLRLLKVEKYIVKAHQTPRQVMETVVEVLQRYRKIPKS